MAPHLFCFVLMWPKAVDSRPARLFSERVTACLEPRLQTPSQIHAHQHFISAGTMEQVPREEVRLRQASDIFYMGHSGGLSRGAEGPLAARCSNNRQFFQAWPSPCQTDPIRRQAVATSPRPQPTFSTSVGRSLLPNSVANGIPLLFSPQP